MNHPGIIFTLFWLLVLSISPSVIRWKNQQTQSTASTYVCPPCACSGHGEVFDHPGQCSYCDMPLIADDYPKVPVIEWSLRSEGFFILYYHKLFYPAYFLAIFLCLFTGWRYRQDPQVLLFMTFFLVYILYAFKSQLAGTGHSMRFPPRWFFFPGTFLLAAGPALWLYGRQYGERKGSFGRREALHFLPAALVILVNLVLFIGEPSWRYSALYNGFDHYPAWSEQLVFLFSGTYYGWNTGILVPRKTEGPGPQRKWLYGLLGAHFIFIVLWAILLLANFFLYNGMSTSLEYHWIWLYTAIFSLAGTFMIISHKEILFPPAVTKELRLDQSEMDVLKDRLHRLMEEEKPYLNPDLNLQGLADLLGMKEKDLSELLNTGLETSFYAYINTYRLEEVRNLLLDPEKQHLTNLAIAEEAGFSSRSTFFSLFKKRFGMTPGAFKKSHSQ
ncbi:helix-turn-helix domain-containing protein [Flavilitoribacter nigricans]|nr:helix-turn-helix domain-containing protein [Flavilitoribacter nigricans]